MLGRPADLVVGLLLLVAFCVAVGVDDGFETVRVEVALQRLVGALKPNRPVTKESSSTRPLATRCIPAGQVSV